MAKTILFLFTESRLQILDDANSDRCRRPDDRTDEHNLLLPTKRLTAFLPILHKIVLQVLKLVALEAVNLTVNLIYPGVLSVDARVSRQYLVVEAVPVGLAEFTDHTQGIAGLASGRRSNGYLRSSWLMNLST